MSDQLEFKIAMPAEVPPASSVSFTVECPDEISLEIDEFSKSAAAATAALLPAMSQRVAVEVPAGLTPLQRKNFSLLQDVFSTVFPVFHRVRVDAPEISAPPSDSPPRTACFFSGGVDSFYTILKNRSSISALIFVHGLDIWYDDLELAERVRGHLQAAAKEMGLPFIAVRTDVKKFCNSEMDWVDHYHGSCIGAVANLLSLMFDRFLIAATHPYRDFRIEGSNPLTDPLWATERAEIVYEGGEANRIEKIKFIADDPVVRRHLRICWENNDGKYNCGKCEKCHRTRLALAALGKLDGIRTFEPDPLPRIEEIDLDKLRDANVMMWHEPANLEEDGVGDPEAKAVLREVARRVEIRSTIKKFARNNRDVVGSPEWAALLPKIRRRLLRSVATDEACLSHEVLSLPEATRKKLISALIGREWGWTRKEIRRRRLEKWMRRLPWK